MEDLENGNRCKRGGARRGLYGTIAQSPKITNLWHLEWKVHYLPDCITSFEGSERRHGTWREIEVSL